MLETPSGDFYDHDGPNGKTDREGDRLLMTALHEQFPDPRATIEDMIAGADKAFCRNLWCGTAQDGWLVEFKGIVIWGFAGGRVVERWASVGPPTS